MLTVRSLVRQLGLGMPDTEYYFCETADCDAAYFAFEVQAPLFHRRDLIARVGVKETARPDSGLYCFGFTQQDVWDEIREIGKSTVAERIAAKVKAGRCACEVKNPVGKWCLGDVTRIAKDKLSQKGESKL